MKPFLYLCLLGIVAGLNSQNAHAQQFAEGTWQVGLKDGYSRGNILKNRNGLQVYSGYFIAKNLLIGAGATWSKEWFETIRKDDVTIGPLVRYQFLDARFSPFIEASYQFGKSFALQNRHLGIVFINPGLSILVLPSFRIDLGYSLQFGGKKGSPTAFIRQPQVGVNYLFGQK